MIMLYIYIDRTAIETEITTVVIIFVRFSKKIEYE